MPASQVLIQNFVLVLTGNTFKNRNANSFQIFTWRIYPRMEFLWLFLFCLWSEVCFPSSFNYKSVLFLASLGFRCLSATFCSSSSPSSSHANTCLFGSYHLCNSDCNSSHGNHRKASIFIVSICFHLFIKVIYCKLYFHLLRIKSIQYWDTVLFCFVLFVLKRPT